MAIETLTPDEACRRGDEIYDRDIKPLVEPEHLGRFIVIDLETGDFEVDDNQLAASKRAAARRPDAPLYARRVGNATLGRIGGRRRQYSERDESNATRCRPRR